MNKLSEDTRLQTIHIINKCFDLHFDGDVYCICKHGTCNIVSTMTIKFYNLLFNENELTEEEAQTQTNAYMDYINRNWKADF